MTDGIVGGAALYAGILAGDPRPAEDEPLRIGVWTRDGTAAKLMEGLFDEPASRSATFLRSPDDGGSAVICFVEGGRETAAGNAPLAVLELTGLDTGQGASRELAVTVGIDAEGIRVHVLHPATGAEAGALLDDAVMDRAGELVASSVWPEYIRRMPSGISPA